MEQPNLLKRNLPDPPTPHNATRFEALDLLRAVAITLVFFFHYMILQGGQPTWLPKISRFGWTGVDLFFVLSGFLIAHQLFTQMKKEQKFSLKAFFVKRFFRIIPAYWVVLAVYFLFPFFREKEALPPLWKFLTFTQNFTMNPMNLGTFSHAWSLCVEEHFYFFLPLMLLGLQRLKILNSSFVLVALLFISGFAIRTYCYQQLYLPRMDEENSWIFWYKYLYYPTYTRLDGLLVGVTIAMIYVFRPVFWKKITRYGNAILVASLLLLYGASCICEDEQSFAASIFGFPLVDLGYGLLLISGISPGSVIFGLKSRASTFIAAISFSIYLTHKGMVRMTHRLLDPLALHENLMLVICIFTSLAGAYLLYKCVEQPFMKLRKKLIPA